MFQQLLRAVGGVLRGVAALSLLGIFLWLTALVDASTIAHAGAHHAALMREIVGAVPWANIVACLTFGVVVFAVWAAWDHVRRWYLMRRPIGVTLVD